MSRFPHVGCLSAGFAGLQQAWHEEGGAEGHNFPFPRCGQNTARVTHKHPKISIEALHRSQDWEVILPTHEDINCSLARKNNPRSLWRKLDGGGWVDKKGRWALGCLEWGGSRVYLRDRRWHESSHPPHTPPHSQRTDWRCSEKCRSTSHWHTSITLLAQIMDQRKDIIGRKWKLSLLKFCFFTNRHKTFKEANSTNINYFYWDCKLFYKWVCNILWHLQHIGYYNLIKLNCECFKRQFWFSFLP